VRLFLTPHPLSRSVAASQIEVEIERPRPAQVTLCFTLTGNIAEIALPAVSAPARRRELWTHTCFEAFLRASDGRGYFEFNFSPSTEWAAYRFDDYRAGMSDALEIGAIPIGSQSAESSYTLKARLGVDTVPGLAHAACWQVGLSAVIEERSGALSYWSLAHPAGKPDFHHPASFAQTLASREPT
jgi:hypothetical protein